MAPCVSISKAIYIYIEFSYPQKEPVETLRALDQLQTQWFVVSLVDIPLKGLRFRWGFLESVAPLVHPSGSTLASSVS